MRDFNFLHYLERGVGLRGWDEDGEAAFVGDVERIEAEDFARALHCLLHGNQSLFQLDADIAVGGDLVQRRGETAAGQIAQAMDFDSGIQ